MEIKSYLHHILPPLSIIVVIVSIIQIFFLLRQINEAALAAFLSDFVAAFCLEHVDDAKDGKSNWDWDQGVEHNCFHLRARFFAGINFKCCEVYESMDVNQQ